MLTEQYYPAIFLQKNFFLCISVVWILNPRSFLTVFQGGNDCLLCPGKCPLYLILTNGGEIALGS